MPTKLSTFAVATTLAAAPLASCAVGPDFAKPQATVAQNWRATDPQLAAQTAADSLWWRSFNDASLDQLVELAYRQNLPLQIAGLRIVEARARLGIATGQQFPQVQAAIGSATAEGLSKNTPIGTFLDRHYGNYQIGFDAAWELDFWGKYRRAVESEGAGLMASVADYYNALVSLNAEVARTYVTVRTFEMLIKQAQDNAKVQEEALAIAQARFHNGATSELDPSQAQTQLESTRATIPQLQVSLEQARNALSTLLGRPAGAVDALLGAPGEIPHAPVKVAVGMPAELLRRRPDIRSAEYQAAAQCARIGVAKAELYPSFTLMGTVGLQTTSGVAISHSNFFSTNSLFYSVGPHLNWPILNYGRLTNNVRVEDARFQQLLVGYRDAVLRAAQEVEDALTGFLNSQKALVFEQNAVKAAQRSVEISVVQYREGAVDFQRVLDAQRSLLQEQNALTQTSSSVATNLIALYKALGGGWEVRQGQPVIPAQTETEMKQRTNWGNVLSQPRGPEAAAAAPPAQH
jgi:NodT family efflux transporter outer membrane factor (OMF) lipoprotein